MAEYQNAEVDWESIRPLLNDIHGVERSVEEWIQYYSLKKKEKE